MKFRRYLKDKWLSFVLFALVILCVTALQLAFKVNASCTVAELILMAISFAALILYDYFRRNRFYKDLMFKLEELDQKYLIIEMIDEPEFEEGKILNESLYQINKSMKEKINDVESANKEFKEFLELWIHEIKLPLASLTLINYNGNNNPEKEKVLIRKIERYVEQILFMARADMPQKDYLIKKSNLETIVNNAVINNKDLLIESKIMLEKSNLQIGVYTDSKWLEFILGQLISNCVKYAKTDEKKQLKFSAYEDKVKKKVILEVYDNGIGIAENDIVNVFEKTFTGSNGRKTTAATGMGLYICRKLCDKLGHIIRIESEENKYTKVIIEFGKDTYYLK